MMFCVLVSRDAITRGVVVCFQDEEGRCYADSFQELPTWIDEPPPPSAPLQQQDSDKKTK